MRWRQNQYLLFNNCIGKINKIGQRKKIQNRYSIKNDTVVKIRRYSRRRYSYQTCMSMKNLDKLHKERKVRIIPPEEVMKILCDYHIGLEQFASTAA